MHYELIAPGEVWLVGAGAGDPGLLTRKAEEPLKAAMIVFHDTLVGSGVMDLIPAGVHLGVNPGRKSCHPTGSGVFSHAGVVGRMMACL